MLSNLSIQTGMNGTVKPVTLPSSHGEIPIVVSRITYGAKLERNALYRKFVADHDDPDNVRWNFVCLSVQTLEGAPCELAHSSDIDEEFERKLQGLFALEDETVEAWIAAVNEMVKPLVERAQLPDALLTDEEKKASTSGGAEKKSKTKSGDR